MSLEANDRHDKQCHCDIEFAYFQWKFPSVFDTDVYLKSLDFQKQKLRKESTKWIWLNAYYDSVKLFVTLEQGIVEKRRM